MTSKLTWVIEIHTKRVAALFQLDFCHKDHMYRKQGRGGIASRRKSPLCNRDGSEGRVQLGPRIFLAHSHKCIWKDIHALSALCISRQLSFCSLLPSYTQCKLFYQAWRRRKGPSCQPVCIDLSVGGIVCFAAPPPALYFIDLLLQGKGRVH